MSTERDPAIPASSLGQRLEALRARMKMTASWPEDGVGQEVIAWDTVEQWIADLEAALALRPSAPERKWVASDGVDVNRAIGARICSVDSDGVRCLDDVGEFFIWEE